MVSEKFSFKNSKFYKECMAHHIFCHPATAQFQIADIYFNIAFNITENCTAQLGERRSTEREVADSNPGRTYTQALKITDKKVLPL